MLRAPVDPSFDVENVPDSGTLTADLKASDLRVLVWNHDNPDSGADNWTRLCFGNVASSDCDANASSLQGSDNGDLPLYDDPYIETPTQLCFAFHKNGATAYLGVSDIANEKGVVGSDLATACAEATALVPVAPTKDYHNLGGGVANDQTWAEND
jgi:hypothetical protein